MNQHFEVFSISKSYCNWVKGVTGTMAVRVPGAATIADTWIHSSKLLEDGGLLDLKPHSLLSTSTLTMFLHALRGVRYCLPKLRSPFPFFLLGAAVKITVICKNNFHKQFVFAFCFFFPPNIFAFYFGFTFFFSISGSWR